jgi:hypothetical protein
MATGIILPNLMSIVASTSQAIIETSNSANPSISGSAPATGPWTPPQWSEPAVTSLTVTYTGSAVNSDSTNSALSSVPSVTVTYVFDSVLRAMHRRTVKKTQHPVLTGANITDHAYIEPAKLTLEIGMSDAMASFSSGMWAGWGTKSVSAWQILKSLELGRYLINVTTRLDTYSNMLITDCYAADENKTKHGLRATVVLEEFIAAGVTSTSTSSARPQVSGANPSNNVSGVSPDPSQALNHIIPSSSFSSITLGNFSGAGTCSSNNLGQLAD